MKKTMISKIMLLFFDVQKEVIFSQSNSKLTAVEGGGWNEFLVLAKKVFHPKAPEESTCMFDQICQYLFRSF